MSKRFLDTDLWKKAWFRNMGLPEKVAWFYILTNCDPVGVWDADLGLAEFCIGSKVDWDSLRSSANGNIEILPNGKKWWLVDFCRFQYGVIRPGAEAGVQKSLYVLLLKHNLWKRYSESTPTVATVSRPDTKDKEKSKEKDKESYAEGVRMTKAEYSALVGQYTKPVIDLAIKKVSAQQIKSGKQYKSPRGAILQWGIRAALEEMKKTGPPKHEQKDYCPECHIAGGHGAFCSRQAG